MNPMPAGGGGMGMMEGRSAEAFSAASDYTMLLR